jgi:hypothetical protein
MKRWFFYTIVAFLSIVIIGAAAYNSRTIRETARADSDSPPERVPGLSFQQAQELTVILQDTSLTDFNKKLSLIRKINIPEGTPYSKVLADSSLEAKDKIVQLLELVNKNILSGQLAARIISLDEKIDSNTKSKMIQNFGSPPPVYPKVFNGTNSADNEMSLIQAKKF